MSVVLHEVLKLICVGLLSFASMKVFSGRSSTYFEMARGMHRWFTDSISLANHAGGLRARVDMNVVFSPFLFESSLREYSGASQERQGDRIL